MKPVDQTLFGAKDGNCFQACLASILELPLDEIPHFMLMRGDWMEHLADWMKPRGLFSVDVSLQHEKSIACLTPNLYVILSGQSSRGVCHAVVGRTSDDVANPGFTLEHDPHPSREFFCGVEPEWVMFVGRQLSHDRC